jgi:hypothetical protein
MMMGWTEPAEPFSHILPKMISGGADKRTTDTIEPNRRLSPCALSSPSFYNLARPRPIFPIIVAYLQPSGLPFFPMATFGLLTPFYSSPWHSSVVSSLPFSFSNHCRSIRTHTQWPSPLPHPSPHGHFLPFPPPKQCCHNCSLQCLLYYCSVGF